MLNQKHWVANDFRIKIMIGIIGFLLCFANSVLGLEKFPRNETHRGVVDLLPYQIYPENRMGNGLYLDKKLLVSHPKRMILKIQPIQKTNSHVYLYQKQNDILGLDVINGKEDGEGRISQVDPEFYQYTNRTLGIQRVFRIINGNIKDLLNKARTGTGVSVSPTHAVFYHITNSQTITRLNEAGDNETEVVVTFRLHLVDRKKDEVASIYKLRIEDASYRLKLKWEDGNTISYKTRDGKKHLVDLKKYVPHYFR